MALKCKKWPWSKPRHLWTSYYAFTLADSPVDAGLYPLRPCYRFLVCDSCGKAVMSNESVFKAIRTDVT